MTSTQKIKLSKRQLDASRAMTAGHNVFITGPAGTGKCMAAGSQILTSTGLVINVEDVREGDLLMGDDSTDREVLSTTSGTDVMFRVTTSHGDSYVVNSDHILTLSVKPTMSEGLILWGDRCGMLHRSEILDSMESYRVDVPIKFCIGKDAHWHSVYTHAVSPVMYSPPTKIPGVDMFEYG